MNSCSDLTVKIKSFIWKIWYNWRQSILIWSRINAIIDNYHTRIPHSTWLMIVNMLYMYIYSCVSPQQPLCIYWVHFIWFESEWFRASLQWRLLYRDMSNIHPHSLYGEFISNFEQENKSWLTAAFGSNDTQLVVFVSTVKWHKLIETSWA